MPAKLRKKTITRAEAEAAAYQVVQTNATIDELDAKLRIALAEATQQYAPTRENLIAKREAAEAIVAAFVGQHRTELLGDQQSTDFGGCRVGYRKGAPKLEYAMGETTESIWQKLAALGGKWRRALRERKVVSIDKKALIATAETEGIDALRGAGVEIVQSESFYIK